MRGTLGPAAQDWPLIVADVSEPSTLDAMAAGTQVVVTTVGPYTRYGLPVVAACATAGTDYADLTGEVMFVRASIDLYHQQAVDTGARIVFSCGFASIPSDLNVHQLYRQTTRDGAGCGGPHNTRIVRRSNALQGWPYGSRFRYPETMSLGRSFAAPVASAAVTGAMASFWALGTRHFRRLPQRWLNPIAKPGTGPSEAMRERGHYTVETYSTTTSGARYMATFAQQCDAYNASGIPLGESGLALALDRDRLTDLRGILTPAAAMGDALLARLPAVGVSMSTIRLN